MTERPDDTWLREGGNDDVADYIAEVVSDRDQLAAELADLRIKHDALKVSTLDEIRAERERAQHLDDVRQVLERDKGILAAELADAQRIGGNAVGQVAYMTGEIAKTLGLSDLTPADAVGFVRDLMHMAEAEREAHARTKAHLATMTLAAREDVENRDTARAERDRAEAELAQVKASRDAIEANWEEVAAEIGKAGPMAWTVTESAKRLVERCLKAEGVLRGLRVWLEIASGLDSHIYGGRAALAGEMLAKLDELERGA